MIYTFQCECGYYRQITASIAVGPPPRVACVKCGKTMDRDWKNDAPFIDTSGCKDHDFIPHQKRVASGYDRGSEQGMEAGFQRDIQARRKEIRDAGGQTGSFRQTHKVPTHLFHGKIKETGDKNYWNDPKNLAKHNSCKVE